MTVSIMGKIEIWPTDAHPLAKSKSKGKAEIQPIRSRIEVARFDKGVAQAVAPYEMVTLSSDDVARILKMLGVLG